jgi:hypothetical protein
MGGEPYEYFVPFNASVEAALESLRQKVFESGKFNGSNRNPSSIKEAFAISEPDGTRSILDISKIGESPDYCTACPLPDQELKRLFGTTKPTHQMIADNMEFYENIERGQAIYIVVYEDGKPAEYFFGGMSFD